MVKRCGLAATAFGVGVLGAFLGCTTFGDGTPAAADSGAVGEPPEEENVTREDASTGDAEVVMPDGGVIPACTGKCASACTAPGESGKLLAVVTARFESNGPFERTPATSISYGALVDDDPNAEGDGNESHVACTDPGNDPEYIRFSHRTLVLGDDRQITRVVVRLRARRDRPGEPSSGVGVAVSTLTGGGVIQSTIMPVGTTYEVRGESFEKAPSSKPWTVAAVNASLVAALFAPADPTNPVRVTQVWLEVCHRGK
jgi:hypothetical protein